MAAAKELRDQIAALEAELHEAQKVEREEQRALREAFVKQWKFIIAPQDKSWGKIYDPSIKRYYLSGSLLNANDYRAIGGCHNEGGMAYLYNTKTEHVIMSEGGGHIYISENDNTADVLRRLGQFIANNPNGGDVTHIILDNPNFKW